MLFHVLNRGVGRMQIFRAEKDYEAFRRVVEETLRVAPIRISPIVGCQTIGTSSFGRDRTASCPTSCSACPICTRSVGNGRSYAWDTGICIKAGSSRSLSRATSTSSPSCGMWSGMLCGQDWFNAPRTGSGEVFATECAAESGCLCPTGRCRSRMIGRSTSTRRKPRRKSRPSDAAYGAEALMETRLGLSAPPSSLGYNRHFEVAADQRKTELDHVVQHYPIYALSPLSRPPFISPPFISPPR